MCASFKTCGGQEKCKASVKILLFCKCTQSDKWHISNNALITRWEQKFRRGNKRSGVASQQGLVQLETYLGGFCLCFLLYGWGRLFNYSFIIYCHTYNRFLFWQRFLQSLFSWKQRTVSFECGGNCTSNMRLFCNSCSFCCVSVYKTVEFKSNSLNIIAITLWLLFHLKLLVPTRLQSEANLCWILSCVDKCKQEFQR